MVKGYSRLQIALHWTTLVLLGVSYLSSDGIKVAWRAFLRGTGDAVPSVQGMVHIWVGVAILALVALRLTLRLVRGVPPTPQSGNRLLELAGTAGHWLLYLLLLAIPGSGITAWFFGVKSAADVHEVLFNLGMAVVALHTVAALFHQYVLKDGLIRRMTRPA